MPILIGWHDAMVETAFDRVELEATGSLQRRTPIPRWLRIANRTEIAVRLHRLRPEAAADAPGTVTPSRTSSGPQRRSRPGPPDARVIKAIGHPLRWTMLEALNDGEASPAQLARRFGEPVNLVAYHMHILAKAGAVELVRTEPRRGSTEHHYRAIMRPTFGDREWARLPRETRRAVLDTEVKKIMRDVRAAATSQGFDHPKAHVSWTALDLDREGIDEVAELLGRGGWRAARAPGAGRGPAGGGGRPQGCATADGGGDPALRAAPAQPPAERDLKPSCQSRTSWKGWCAAAHYPPT